MAHAVVPTAADEPLADAGHEVGWQQVRLPGDPVRVVAAVDPQATSPLDADGHVVHPLLATPPAISLWRAPPTTTHRRVWGGLGGPRARCGSSDAWSASSGSTTRGS
ncbi:MAG: hypothetical protein R3C32_04210 [Chloroflexota bacterium]